MRIIPCCKFRNYRLHQIALAFKLIDFLPSLSDIKHIRLLAEQEKLDDKRFYLILDKIEKIYLDKLDFFFEESDRLIGTKDNQ